MITRDHCGNCRADLSGLGGTTRRISIVDRDLDCVVAYQCPDCGATEDRQLGQIVALADPAAFKEG